MKTRFAFFVVILMSVMLVLSGCGPSPEAVSAAALETVAAWPTYTPYPTYTAYPTYTPRPTRTVVPSQTPWIKIVTPTFTASPVYTSTITETPTLVPPPTSTTDPLKAAKRPGFYLVGVNIAPGVWQSQSSGDDCYWEISTASGDIINNHFGMAGGTMFIAPSAYQVRMDAECGGWIWLQAP